jgi:hypothetical protein
VASTTEEIEKATAGMSPRVEGVSYSVTGLDLDPNLTYDAWTEIGQFIGSLHKASSWFIGDWILHGESAFGEMYAQAVNDLGLDYKTCVNTVYVCKKVPKLRRRSDLPFSHHAEVAPLPPGEQRTYLKKAVENNWTKAELRAAIKNGGELPPAAEQPDWSDESGIHPGGDDRVLPDAPTDADHEAAHGDSPGQKIPGVTPVIGEVLPMPDSNGFIPEDAEQVVLAMNRIAPAAVAVVESRGKKGLRELREALVEAGYMTP